MENLKGKQMTQPKGKFLSEKRKVDQNWVRGKIFVKNEDFKVKVKED